MSARPAAAADWKAIEEQAVVRSTGADEIAALLD